MEFVLPEPIPIILMVLIQHCWQQCYIRAVTKSILKYGTSILIGARWSLSLSYLADAYHTIRMTSIPS